MHTISLLLLIRLVNSSISLIVKKKQYKENINQKPDFESLNACDDIIADPLTQNK